MKQSKSTAMTPGMEARTAYVTMNNDSKSTEEKRMVNTQRAWTPKIMKGPSLQTNAPPSSPSKAPLEITNAIKRRKETKEQLHYWHTLPHAHTTVSKPLYRAVFRGSLTGDSAVCTLSSIVDAVNSREFNMVIKKNNGFGGYFSHNGNVMINGNGTLLQNRHFSVIRSDDSGMGLAISGLSLANDNKIKAQSNQVNSPRISLQNKSQSNLTSKTIQKQRRPLGHIKSTLVNENPANIDSGNDVIKIDTGGVDNEKHNIKADRNKYARLTLTTRQSNLGGFPDTKKAVFSTRKDTIDGNNAINKNTKNKFNKTDTDFEFDNIKDENEINNNTIQINDENNSKSHMIAYQGEFYRQASLPVGSKINNKSVSDLNGKEMVTAKYISSHTTDSILPKRKTSKQEQLSKKMSSQNSFTSSGSPCLQLADSIISALTVDLNKMYSICHTKVRYSEFIEKSQAHRFQEGNSLMVEDGSVYHDNGYGKPQHNLVKSNGTVINSNLNEYSKKHGATNTTRISLASPSDVQSTSPCMSPSSMTSLSPSQISPSTSPSNSTINQNSIDVENFSNKNKLSPRLVPLPNANTNRYMGLRDTSKLIIAADDNMSDQKKTKVARPILKSSKADTSSTNPMTSFRSSINNKADNNNNDTNRLVRFNAKNEIREFAPSEPVIYH